MESDEADRECSLTDLPSALVAAVLSLAGARSAVAALVACRAWHAAADSYPPLWNSFLARDWSPRLADGLPVPADRELSSAASRRLYSAWAAGEPESTLLRSHASEGTRRRLQSLCFTDATTVLSVGDGGCLLQWDAAAGVITSAAAAAHGGAQLSAVCQVAAAVATGGADNAVRFWDLRCRLDEPPSLHLPDAHAGEVTSLAALGGSLLASGGGDGVVRVWDVREPGAAVLELEGSGDGSVFSLAHDARRQRLYAATGRSVCLFDLAAGGGQWLSTLFHAGEVSALALGDAALLTGCETGEVTEWALPPRDAAVEEEPEPVRAEACADGGAAVTALVALGARPAAYLAASWSGRLRLGGHGRPRPFGAPLLQDGVDVPATALAARGAAVAVGYDNGALRFFSMASEKDD